MKILTFAFILIAGTAYGAEGNISAYVNPPMASFTSDGSVITSKGNPPQYCSDTATNLTCYY
jgi:hypothetical protein